MTARNGKAAAMRDLLKQVHGVQIGAAGFPRKGGIEGCSRDAIPVRIGPRTREMLVQAGDYRITRPTQGMEWVIDVSHLAKRTTLAGLTNPITDHEGVELLALTERGRHARDEAILTAALRQLRGLASAVRVEQGRLKHRRRITRPLGAACWFALGSATAYLAHLTGLY